MKLNIQEKNNLYFSLLRIIDSFEDKRALAKELTLFIDNWMYERYLEREENLATINDLSSSEKTSTKKGIFRRV